MLAYRPSRLRKDTFYSFSLVYHDLLIFNSTGKNEHVQNSAIRNNHSNKTKTELNLDLCDDVFVLIL